VTKKWALPVNYSQTGGMNVYDSRRWRAGVIDTRYVVPVCWLEIHTLPLCTLSRCP